MSNSYKDNQLLIFIWLGNQLPNWAYSALKMNSFLSGSQLVIITSNKVKKLPICYQHYYLEDFYFPNNKIYEDEKKNNFRDGFWIKTTERFNVLYQFVIKYGINKFFHAEFDNIVFDIRNLDKKLDDIGKGMFVPRDNINRAIASLIYVNSIEALKFLNDYYQANSDKISNDMELLGKLFSVSNLYYSLPNERALMNKDNNLCWHTISSKSIGGIFDAAAIGQFLLGIDPRNSNKILYNAFENENIGCNLWEYNYKFDKNRKSFLLIKKQTKEITNIYNLHIHSKLFFLIQNEYIFFKILDRISNNKKTLLSFNFINWNIISKLFYFINHFLNNVKKIIF